MVLLLFQDYFQSMPWLAVPYHDNARRQGLADKFGVKVKPSTTIPYTVIDPLYHNDLVCVLRGYHAWFCWMQKGM